MSSRKLRSILFNRPLRKLFLVAIILVKNWLLGGTCFFHPGFLHSHLVTLQKHKQSAWCKGHLSGDFLWRKSSLLLFSAGRGGNLSQFQLGDAERLLMNFYFQRCSITCYFILWFWILLVWFCTNYLCNLGLLMQATPPNVFLTGWDGVVQFCYVY